MRLIETASVPALDFRKSRTGLTDDFTTLDNEPASDAGRQIFGVGRNAVAEFRNLSF